MDSFLKSWKLPGLLGSHVLQIEVKFDSSSGVKTSIPLVPALRINVHTASVTEDRGQKVLAMGSAPQGSIAGKKKKQQNDIAHPRFSKSLKQEFPLHEEFAALFLR